MDSVAITEKKPLVSIVVPFYNPGEYFAELLSSLEQQDYPHLQIILVDDGSDNSYAEMAKEFASRGVNRIVVSKENGGVASARQAGIDAAIGDYLIHVDADDTLPNDAITKLVNKSLDENFDIVVGGYSILMNGKTKYVGLSSDLSADDFLEGLLLGKYHASLWNKLVRRECYIGHVFEPGINYMEDKLFLAKILSVGSVSIGFLNEPVYVYRLHNNSVTMSMTPAAISQSYEAISKIVEICLGVVSECVLKQILKRQRAFVVYQSAKVGLYVFNKEDLYLLFEKGIPFPYRLSIIFSACKVAYLVRWVYMVRRLI